MSHRSESFVVFGEALIDLFPTAAGVDLEDAPLLQPHLGGAPANVAVQLARLGCRPTLLSAVGDGPLGRRVVRMLSQENVDTSAIIVKRGLRTGITLVQVAKDGQRSFTAHRENSADLSLQKSDLDLDILRAAAIVHTGTVTLRSEHARAATYAVRELSPQALQTLDVNLRPGMFPSFEDLCALARESVRSVDVVKLAREEACSLYGDVGSTNDALVDKVLEAGPALVLLTLDEDGALLATRHHRVCVPAPPTQVVDATGAGDAFMGATLAQLPPLRRDCEMLSQEELTKMGTFACRAGALATTALGATTAMLISPGR